MMSPGRPSPSLSSSALRRGLAAAGLAFALVGAACSSSNTTPGAGASSSSSGGAGCESAPTLAKNDFCKSCTFSANASPAACKTPRVLNACCAWVQAPTQELARGTGLNRYPSDDPTIQLGCLDAPATAGASQTVSLKGFLRVFSSGGDSAGGKIEIFKEGPDGALGEPIGAAVTVTADDAKNPPQTPKPEWLKKCPDGGCSFRSFTYEGVPTETPLIVKTSDASGGNQWSELYEYNVYFSNDSVQNGTVTMDPAVVAATDINTIASAAGGFIVKPEKGLLAGEVHDCGDIRLSGATVDTDVAHEADMFYFGENESDPLPDRSRSSLGTSRLGLFGTLNVQTGVPIRVSAVGKRNGETVLLGTYTVQTFPRAITAVVFRGRRPFQK